MIRRGGHFYSFPGEGPRGIRLLNGPPRPLLRPRGRDVLLEDANHDPAVLGPAVLGLVVGHRLGLAVGDHLQAAERDDRRAQGLLARAPARARRAAAAAVLVRAGLQERLTSRRWTFGPAVTPDGDGGGGSRLEAELMSALADYVQAALMLNYHGRRVG